MKGVKQNFEFRYVYKALLNAYEYFVIWFNDLTRQNKFIFLWRIQWVIDKGFRGINVISGEIRKISLKPIFLKSIFFLISELREILEGEGKEVSIFQNKTSTFQVFIFCVINCIVWKYNMKVVNTKKKSDIKNSTLYIV